MTSMHRLLTLNSRWSFDQNFQAS